MSALIPAGAAMGYDARTINDAWMFRYDGDSVAIPVHIPHCWNEDAYSRRDYRRGSGTYTRRLRIPEDLKGGSIYLRLDGAANKSEVLLDGVSIGSHIGGYSSHTIDITPCVTPGKEHMLMVTVDNSDRNIPPYSADFTFMGGLYRDVWLITADAAHLALNKENALRVTPRVPADGSCSLDIAGTVINGADSKEAVNVDVLLETADGRRVASGSAKVSLKKGRRAEDFSISLPGLDGISLWTPETPELYTVKVNLRRGGSLLDSRVVKTGFRTFAFDDKGRFLLNGHPYKLRGMCRHQDQAPMGIALSDEQHRRDIAMIKDMGANFIRISHYPQDDALLELCDRLGLIAWEEIPVIDFVPESAEFADNCEVMLREMIRDHYNHPSIAMWGYMNEILLRMPGENRDETKARTLRLAKRLENAAREEDPTRLTAMAFHGSDIYNAAGLADITDVKGWNLYSGWYGGRLEDFENYLSAQHRDHPGHRLIVSEYGAGSDLRIHSLAPEPFDFSMEYQQVFLEHYLPVIEDSTFIAGASHWNFIDFSSANRAESMPHINNKGLVTNSRRPKDVYYYYKAAWTDVRSDTVAHIASRDWTDRVEIIGESGSALRPVKVYTNLPSVELRAGGVSCGVADARGNVARFDVPLKDGLNVIEVFDAADPVTPLDAIVVALSAIEGRGGAIDLAGDELAVNVGGNCYFRSDHSGLTWLPDKGYTPGGYYGHVGGEPRVSQDEIALTGDGPLLQRALYGVEEYRIDVTPGAYEVELSFAELSSPSAMSAYMLGHNAGSGANPPACMDISINGKQVESRFSPGEEAGVKSMVKRRYFTETGDDAAISVRFTPAEGGTSILSSIKIRKI